MAAPLLTTKLYIPPLRSDAISRPRLIERLNAGRRNKLTLVSAQAGSGKTTLLSEWIHCGGTDESPRTRGTAVLPPAAATTAGGATTAPLQFAWLSLDEGDNDPTRFTTYLVAALQTIDPDIGQAALAISQAPQPPPPESLLTALINDLAAQSHPIVLVLDDYHVIGAPPVHQQVTFLLEHGPTPGLHLVLLTRQDPPLPLSRLRAQGQMTEIRQADLQFTEQEADRFMREAMRLELSSADVAALHQRTEGWAVGLQLAALSLQGRADVRQFVRSFTGSNRYVLDYLIDEVFQRQPADVQDFMLKTSVLEHLTGGLCDAVVEREDSHELLLALERTNLFVVPLDDRREWYRYHHLFRDLLRAQLTQRRQPTDLAPLHCRAAHWYEEHGFLDEAMTHTLATEDWDGAERLMEAAAVQAIDNGQWVTLSRWLEVFPDARVRRDSGLATFQAWAFFTTGQFEAAAEYADLAEELLPDDTEPFDRAMVVCLQACVAQVTSDLPQVMELAEEALELLGQEGPFLLRSAASSVLAGVQFDMGDLAAAARTLRAMASLGQDAEYPLSAVSPLTNLGWILHLQGDPRQGLDLCHQALDQCLDARGETLPLASDTHGTLGSIYFDRYDLDRARQHLAIALELCDKIGPMGERLFILAERARLQQAVGEEQAARATLEELHQLVSWFHPPGAEATAARVEAEILLKQGNIAAAERWAVAAGLSPQDSPGPLREPELLTFVRLLLAQKRWDEAQTLLANCERFAREGGRHRSLIAVRVLQALAQQGLGHKQQALDCLEEALRLAAPGEYRRAFLEGGQLIMGLLPEVRHVDPAFVDSLLSASATPLLSPLPLAQPLIEPLSERELEVLGLVVAGLTNREIADQLFISVGTVKTHTHHIYGKLGVTGRPRAIARARELDLV